MYIVLIFWDLITMCFFEPTCFHINAFTSEVNSQFFKMVQEKREQYSQIFYALNKLSFMSFNKLA